MLRMYLMQNWFNLSDEGVEDEIYDNYAMRSFMHVDSLTQQVPDATTLLHFRHLIEENSLGEKYSMMSGNVWIRPVSSCMAEPLLMPH